jgi:hypothetical protein
VETEVAAANSRAQESLVWLRQAAFRSSFEHLLDVDNLKVGVRLESREPHPEVVAWVSVPLKPGVVQERNGPLKEVIASYERRATARAYQMEGRIVQVAADLLPTAPKVRSGSNGFVQVALLDNGPGAPQRLPGATERFEPGDYPFLVDVLADATNRTTLERKIADRLNQELKGRGWTPVESVSVEIRPDPQAWETAKRGIFLRLSPMPEPIVGYHE